MCWRACRACRWRAMAAGASTSLFLRGAETRFHRRLRRRRARGLAGSGGASGRAIPCPGRSRGSAARPGRRGLQLGRRGQCVVQIFTKKGEAGVSPYVGVGAAAPHLAHRSRRERRQRHGGLRAWAWRARSARALTPPPRLARTATPTATATRPTAPTRLGLQVNPPTAWRRAAVQRFSDSGYDASRRRPQPAPPADPGPELAGAVGNLQDALSITDSQDRYQTSHRLSDRHPGCAATCSKTRWRLGNRQFTAALERRETELVNAPSTAAARRKRAWRWATA